MKKRNCLKCGSCIEVKSSEFVKDRGKEKVRWEIDCAEFGVIVTIVGGAIPWKTCFRYSEDTDMGDTMKVRSEERDRLNKEMGIRIKAIRKQLQITQQTLGDKCNTARVLLTFIEHGKISPRLELLVCLVRDFKVDGTYLLTGEGEMFRKEG